MADRSIPLHPNSWGRWPRDRYQKRKNLLPFSWKTPNKIELFGFKDLAICSVFKALIITTYLCIAVEPLEQNQGNIRMLPTKVDPFIHEIIAITSRIHL